MLLSRGKFRRELRPDPALSLLALRFLLFPRSRRVPAFQRILRDIR